MTKVAIIADIHGNDIALQRVLEDLNNAGITQIVCLGDVAATGPQPRQVVQRLCNLDVPVVMGNADAEILNPPDPAGASEPMNKIFEISAWGQQQLSNDELDFIAGFPATIELDLTPSTSLLCVHGSPTSFDDQIRSETSATDLDAMLSGTIASFVAAGHTHTSMLRRHRGQTLINPGSVGLSHHPAAPSEDIRYVGWAEFCILDVQPYWFDCRFMRVPYNVDELTTIAQDGGMPHAEWWTGLWIREGAV